MSRKKINPAKTLEHIEVQVPHLPDKLFFSIREVSKICDIEPHVLRYWETEFKQLKPIKKSGNRRFYRHKDVHQVYKIKHLLYNLKFTIRGAKNHFTKGVVSNKEAPAIPKPTIDFKDIYNDLKDIKDLLESS